MQSFLLPCTVPTDQCCLGGRTVQLWKPGALLVLYPILRKVFRERVWPCLTMARLCRRSTYLVLSNRPRNRTRLFTSHLACGCILPQWRSQRHFFELSGKQGSCVLGAFQVHTPNVFMQKWCEHSLTKVLFENLIGMFRNGRWATRQIFGVWYIQSFIW